MRHAESLATHGFFADEKFRSMSGHDVKGEQLFGGMEMASAKATRSAVATQRRDLLITLAVVS